MNGPDDGATRRARRSGTVQALGRAGMFCYGIVHLILAYLAVTIAFGSGVQQADAKGAIAAIAATSFGVIALWMLAFGLVLFGLWQFLLMTSGYSWVDKRRELLARRVGSGARGVVVVALGAYAAIVASGGGSGGSGDQQKRALTARLLALPAGQVLVAAVAAVVLGVGIAALIKAVTRSFLDDLDVGDLPGASHAWLVPLGVIGYLAKAIMLGIIAALVGLAAFNANAKRAGGLDAALHTLAGRPYGQVMLSVVAFGFGAFAVYCAVAVRCHKN